MSVWQVGVLNTPLMRFVFEFSCKVSISAVPFPDVSNRVKLYLYCDNGRLLGFEFIPLVP